MMTKLGRSSSKEVINSSEETSSTPSSSEPNKKFAEYLRRLEENDPNIATCIEFTKKHPMGAIMLKMAQDNTMLAGDRGLSTNIPDLCTAFHEACLNEKAEMDEKLAQTHKDIHASLINKELNSHHINSSLKPPENFSEVPTINSTQRLSEVLKVFPRGNKFSGSKQDSNMTVVEFLNTLKTAQNQCKLSKDEFIDRMLEASTGQAHELILEWVNHGETIATIYHNLLVNYDKRMSPQAAKLLLASYTVPKNSSLAKAEAAIMLLASRAATLMPEGKSRTDTYNTEACNALIRALPPKSSDIVSNIYTTLSAQLERSATAAELSRKLNLNRATIDKDIKEHGSVPIRNKGKDNRKGQKFAKEEYTSFNNTVITAPRRTRKGSQTNTKYAYNTTSFTPKPYNAMSKFFKSRTGDGQQNNSYSKNQNKGIRNKKKVPPRGPNGKFIKTKTYNTNNSSRSCLLCGMVNHTATNCRNMITNSGDRVQLVPTRGTCSVCPPKTSGRLHHPPSLCPFRPGGAFNKKGN